MIYVISRDSDTPMGGVRQQYHLTDALISKGHKATVLHSLPGFRCSWFPNKTPVAYTRDVHFTATDMVVVPDEIAHYFATFDQCDYVIFNQNPYLFLGTVNYDFDVRRAEHVLENPRLRGMIVVSSSSLDFMQYAFPRVPTARIHYGIDTVAFCPVLKDALVAYMPRRGRESLELVLRLLELRGVVSRSDVLAIDGVSQDRVALGLGRSRIFLSGSTLEGFGLPVAEALACGAHVVGYDGEGGRELFSGSFATGVPGGDVLSYAKAVEQVIGLLRDDVDAFERIAVQGRQFIVDNYSVFGHADDVRDAWHALGLHSS